MTGAIAMRRRQGFTLVELLVLIGIIGVVMALGIPSFNNFVRNNRLASATDRLAADIQLARSMSISTGQIHRMVATPEGYSVINLASGTTIREREFEGTVTLAAGATVNFFPWGMADAASFDVESCAGTRNINLLPTGIVEVN
jgi:prepilin-type N-terminal cleavage/methylation domain-containing protein